MTARIPASAVDALVPLSFLEAVRDVDAPDGDLDAEYVPELRNKRFGLSDTVYAQIQRYAEAVRRGQRIPLDEAVALARLVGRRPDAEVVFRTAGRYLADETCRRIFPLARSTMRVMPSVLARPFALRHIRRIAARYLGGDISRIGSSLLLKVENPITRDAAPRQAGCAYYEATLRELLRMLIDGAGAVEHVRCGSRGEGMCEWRAEWRRAGR